MNRTQTSLTRLLVALSLVVVCSTTTTYASSPDEPAAAPATASEKPCRWWQFGCEDEKVEGLPKGAPREGVVVTVDISTQTAYLFRDAQLVKKAPVSTGTDKVLKKGRRFWLFRTPRGRHKVLRKIVDPIWTKPDWAYIEEKKPIPPPNSPARQIKGKLGRYALDLGDGILLHGTPEVDKLGQKASHGCIRLPAEMLETVYQETKVGTEVWIFESQPNPANASIHSDLDYLK